MNIKKHLLETLRVDSVLELTGDGKVYFLHAENPVPPYVEYEVISEYGTDFSEGTEKYTKYLIQVDIFSFGNYTKLETEIKNVMIQREYSRDQAADLFEKETKLYHKAMRFNISLPC